MQAESIIFQERLVITEQSCLGRAKTFRCATFISAPIPATPWKPGVVCHYVAISNLQSVYQTEKVIERLRNFEPSPDGDWSEFIELLDALWKTNNPYVGYRTLFELLEKFDDDYMECQWSVIHGMEHSGRYEKELIESLRRKPAHLTLVMLSRIINSGEKEIDGIRIQSLLNEIIENHAVNEDQREFALDCILRLRKLDNDGSSK